MAGPVSAGRVLFYGASLANGICPHWLEDCVGATLFLPAILTLASHQHAAYGNCGARCGGDCWPVLALCGVLYPAPCTRAGRACGSLKRV